MDIYRYNLLFIFLLLNMVPLRSQEGGNWKENREKRYLEQKPEWQDQNATTLNQVPPHVCVIPYESREAAVRKEEWNRT
jgi:hypothetical protein